MSDQHNFWENNPIDPDDETRDINYTSPGDQQPAFLDDEPQFIDEVQVSPFLDSDVFFEEEAPLSAEATPKARAPIQTADAENILRPEAPARPKRRRAARPVQRGPGTFWQVVRTFSFTSMAALLIATIFSYWTPDDFLSPEFREAMRVVSTTQEAVQFSATPLPTQVSIPKVGIIAGHSGPPEDPSFVVDPGAICDDNLDGIAELTELEINVDVAEQVVDKLLRAGYEVDLLEEFDPRLANYRADALVSIHTNDCQNYGFGATGYNVAGPASRGPTRGIDEGLVNCILDRYGATTQLPRHTGLTEDMTFYHTFSEVSVDTPVAIIEIGFMFADRQIVTQRRDVIADGIYQGLICFLDEPESS